MEYQIASYKISVNKTTRLFPNTVLFSNDKEQITVTMAQDAINYIFNEISKKKSSASSYETAKRILTKIMLLLQNKQTTKPNKEDLKTTIDVLSEIRKQYVESDAQKINIDRAAFCCKLLINYYAST